MSRRLSRYLVVTEPFVDADDGRGKRILFGTRSAQRRLIDETSWQQLANGRFDLLPESVVRDLEKAEIVVDAAEVELTTILQQNNTAAHDQVLYLVVQPTASCQLGCDYCGQAHTAQKLAQAEQDRLIERVRAKLASGSYRSLRIGWFGGEPLLGIAVMDALTPRFQSLATEFGCCYSAKVVTNGLALKPDMATHLVRDLAVDLIEVTLDGPAEFHDARRHLKKGGPTFERIFANVVDLARRDDLKVSLSLRCNVDGRNISGVVPLLQLLADAGIQKRIAAFYLAPVHSWGNDAHDRALSDAEFAAAEVDWYVTMIELGFTPGLLPARKAIACMATRPAADLVDPFGNLFNCSEVSLVPTYETPKPGRIALPMLGAKNAENRFAIGDLANGERSGRREVLGSFYERIGRGEYACHDCRMLPVCGGSCPKQWLEGRVPCPSAKHNIEQRLLLSHALARLNRVPI